MKPLPEPFIEDHDWELWGQNRVSNLYTEEQMKARDAEWEEEVNALVYLYLTLTEAMGYESSSELSPEEWAEKMKRENDESTG